MVTIKSSQIGALTLGARTSAQSLSIVTATDSVTAMRSRLAPKLWGATLTATTVTDIFGLVAGKRIVVARLRIQNNSSTETILKLITGENVGNEPEIVLAAAKGAGASEDFLTPVRLGVGVAFQGQLSAAGSVKVGIHYWLEDSAGVPDSAFII